MNLLLDPNVAYVLLVSGLLVAVLALFAPGTGLLEIGALFMLVLAGYGIYNLEINLWALIVLVVGVFPFLLALRKSRQWVFLLISMAALVIGSIFVFRGTPTGPAVNPFLAVVVSILSIGLMWWIGRKGLEAINAPVVHTLERLPGEIGEAHTVIEREGSVYIEGEEWSARSSQRIPVGAHVRVISRDGLTLTVEQVSDEQKTN
jgi:membrane-bound serine protease (ClpP class)